jgi:hypothetical protein
MEPYMQQSKLAHSSIAKRLLPAIDKTVEHYQKKVEFLNGPKVVKTFK